MSPLLFFLYLLPSPQSLCLVFDTFQFFFYSGNQLLCFVLIDLWGIEEIDVESQLTSKHAANEDSKESVLDKTHLTQTGEQESVKEVSGVATTEIKEQVSPSTVTLEKQEKPAVVAATTSSDLCRNEEVSEGKRLELKDQLSSQESVTHEQSELPSHITEQTSQHETNNQEKTDENRDPSQSELSKTLTGDTTSGKTADVDLQTTLHKRENSSGSVDSSWSKLSDEELKANGDKEGTFYKRISLERERSLSRNAKQ